jgi:hypothetical protein
MVKVRNKLGTWNVRILLQANLSMQLKKCREDYKSTYYESAKPNRQIADRAMTMRPYFTTHIIYADKSDVNYRHGMGFLIKQQIYQN